MIRNCVAGVNHDFGNLSLNSAFGAASFIHLAVDYGRGAD